MAPGRFRGRLRRVPVSRWRAFASTFVLTVALFCSACADSLFYFPTRLDYGAGLVGRDVFFRAPAGPRLHGVWIDALGPRRGTVVYCHGNDRNLTHHSQWVDWLPRQGFDLLLFDYRGYGRSEGRPSREGIAADARAAIDLALLADPERVFVWGRSLGAAAAVSAVATRPAVRGLLLEGGFARWRSVARRRVPILAWAVPFLVSDGPDPVDETVGEVPVLLIHGADDGVVAVREAGETFDALQARGGDASTRLVVFGGVGHRTAHAARTAEFEALVGGFLASCLTEPEKSRTE